MGRNFRIPANGVYGVETDRIAGRTSADTGTLEQLTAAQVRALLSVYTVSQVDAALADKADSDHSHLLEDITDAGELAGLDTVGTAQLNDDVVTSAKLADDLNLPGAPTAATADPGANTTQIATTEFVTTAVAAAGVSSPLTLTSDVISETPLTLEAAAGQIANVFNINSNGGIGGDLFHVTADGILHAASGSASSPGMSFVADPDSGFLLKAPGHVRLSLAGDENVMAWTTGIIVAYKPFRASGDAEFNGELRLPEKTDATRGAPGTARRIIFNSDDGQLNIDDGVNWTLPDGTTT